MTLLPSAADRQNTSFSLRPALLLLAVLSMLALFSDLSGLDVLLENHYYDAAQHVFPLRDQVFFSQVLHEDVRKIMVMLLLGVLVLPVLANRYALFANNLPELWRKQRLFTYLAAVFVSGPVVVGLLKQVTTHSCPWNMAQYGGSIIYGDFLHIPLFSLSAAGHCFPGAHASVGFTLFAFVPLLERRWQWPFTLGVLMFGLLLGWVQMARGAHFLSHNLWSAVIAWAVMLFWYFCLQPGLLMRKAEDVAEVSYLADAGEA